MRATACFERHLDRSQLFEKPQQFAPPQDAPRRIHRCDVKTDLDVSIATRGIAIIDGPEFGFLTAEQLRSMPRGRLPQRNSL
jgi:hypothetical protein